MLNYKHYEIKEKLLPLIELQLNTRLSRNGVEAFDVCEGTANHGGLHELISLDLVRNREKP